MTHKKNLKIIFAGTPDIAATVLKELLTTPHDIVAVYTQPDRPSGRGRKLMASPVKQLAIEHNIPVEQPKSLKQEPAQHQLKQYEADVMVVVAYGLILPQAVLDIPVHGCINVHVSLLPRWRGAAPIQHAILAGDQESGVTIMQMDAGLDTGPILLQQGCPITASETSGTLHDKLAELGADNLIKTLSLLVDDKLSPQPQTNEHASYANKINKADAQIKWQQTAKAIDCAIRAYNPWPIAYTHHHDSVIRIWQAQLSATKNTEQKPGTIVAMNKQQLEVQTGDGILTITKIQLPGAKALPLNAILNGRPELFQIGQQFQ